MLGASMEDNRVPSTRNLCPFLFQFLCWRISSENCGPRYETSCVIPLPSFKMMFSWSINSMLIASLSESSREPSASSWFSKGITFGIVSLHAEWLVCSKAFVKEKLWKTRHWSWKCLLELSERPSENMSWVSRLNASLFVRISISIKKFLCKTSRGEKIDPRFWMIETVIQDKNMLCPCVVDESNLNSPFLKTGTSPICSREVFVRLLNATWDKFPNVVADVASGWVITNEEWRVSIKMNLSVQLFCVNVGKWFSETSCICSLRNAKCASLGNDACISLGDSTLK